MHVVMVASEVAPFAKTGGLADVLGALPRALSARGVQVSVVMPKYGSILPERHALRPTGWTLQVPISNQVVATPVWQAQMHTDVPVYLIAADQYFARSGLYGTRAGDYLDNAERFAFFSRASLELLRRLDSPAVLHCHDWQAALAAAFLRLDAPRYPELARVRSMLTVHNLGYQGLFWHYDWHLLNLDWRYFTPDYLEFYGKINYLKGGLVCADALTTVSPTYAAEIQTPELGCGLDGVLVHRRNALTGILNGADYDTWSPERDAYIAAGYLVDDLAGKAACKADLQTTVGLPVDARLPLLGMVSRLVREKGVDILCEALPALLRKRVQVILLGAGDPTYQQVLDRLAREHRKRLAVQVAFDEALAHKIEAGSDIFLMPSRYEPCGLSQMYSLRYGTIPIVHATGGLQDTVVDIDAKARSGTGFKFAEYSGAALLAAAERALKCYRTPALWRALVQNAMRADFSWGRSAAEYERLYRGLARG